MINIGFVFVIVIAAAVTSLKGRDNGVIRDGEMRLLFIYIADRGCDCVSLTVGLINVHA